MRVLGVFIFISALSDAFVEFENSRLYDEQDFQENPTLLVKDPCYQGCLIFVSYPDGSSDMAENMLIFANSVTTSFTEANTKDEKGRKVPYPVKSGSITFLNKNPGTKSAAVIVWVITGDAPNVDAAEVYDADAAPLAPTPGALITILDAEPFVISTATDGPMTVCAYTAGFDAFDSADKCTRVLRIEDPLYYQDVIITVQSPMITFHFDLATYNDSNIVLQASRDGVPSFDLTKPNFITSPGYIGCAVNMENAGSMYGTRHKTFRSSLYGNITDVELNSEEPTNFRITTDLNIDNEHPVETSIDDEPPKKWFGFNSAPSLFSSGKKLDVSWTRNEDDLDQYFLMRVEPDYDVRTTVDIRTTTEMEKTTTSEVESTTAFDGEKTTTEAGTVTWKTTSPEPLEGTTTAPVQYTTVEPVTSSTIEPIGSEPTETTTAEPFETSSAEPVMTTSEEPETTTNIPASTTVKFPETYSPEPNDGTIRTTEPAETTTEKPLDTTTAKPVPSTTAKQSVPTTTTPFKPTHRTTPSKKPGTKTTTSAEPTSTITVTKSTSASATTESVTTSGKGYESTLLSFLIMTSMMMLPN